MSSLLRRQDHISECLQVQTQACGDGELRISGLQLPQMELGGAQSGAASALAVMQTTTYRWSFAEDLRGYARAGIGGIGLYRPKLEEVEEEVAIDAIRSSGLNVTSLSWVGGFTGSDGRRQEEGLFDAQEAVRFAAAVGSGTVGVCSGSTGQHIDRHARRLLNDALGKLCDFAADAEVRIALHPFSNRGGRARQIIATLDETLEAIAAASRPNLGLVLDIAELAGEEDLLGRIAEVAPFVHVIRISDRRHRLDRRRHFSDRPTQAAAIVTTMLETGYAGPVEFDLWSDEDRPASEYDDLLADCRSRFEAIAVASSLKA